MLHNFKSRLACSASLLFAISSAGANAAIAQEAEPAVEPPPKIRISNRPPPGFEAVDDSVMTVFDVEFAGKRIGSSSAKLVDDTIQFTDPEGLAALFPPTVDRQKLIEFFSRPLASNESLRCLPGRSGDCGILPADTSGVIVNPEFFRVQIYLAADFYSEIDNGPIYLADPTSGPSLIQTGQFSLSTGRNALGELRFGAVLDTLASIGRSSLVAQTLARDNSTNLQQAYLQHFWNRRRAAAGILQDEQSITFRGFRMLGAEFGSFYGARLDYAEGSATPITIVMPQAGTVEIFKDGVLIQSRRVEAGLQTIDTNSFPPGSYPIQIIGRVGNSTVVDEIQTYTRVSNLPPAGETSFSVRGGTRIRDFFNLGTQLNLSDQPFFPIVTNEPIITASASRRIGGATGISGQVLSVDGKVFGELSAITYRNNLSGLIAFSGGADGSYAGQINGTLRIRQLDFSLSARHAKVADDDTVGPVFDRYTPYFRSEDVLTASANLPVANGTLSLSGSYSHTPLLEDRYSYGFRYTRALNVSRIGSVRLSLFGLSVNKDKRVGLSVSLFRRLNAKTIAFASLGTEYRDGNRFDGNVSGVFPVAEGRISRNDQFGTVDLLSQAGVSTDAERSRAFASGNVSSNLGIFDATVDYEDRRGSLGDDGFSLTANAFTGFVYTGGKFATGIREPGGQAAVLVEIERGDMPQQYTASTSSDGKYTVVVDNREAGEFKANGSTVIMLPEFRQYAIQLQPEQAPPYIIDLSRKNITLYPGNVVHLSYAAQLGVTIFGRLTDQSGQPIPNARVSANSDVTISDEFGYFLVSGPLDASLEARKSDGATCQSWSMKDLFSRSTRLEKAGYLRIGNLTCTPE